MLIGRESLACSLLSFITFIQAWITLFEQHQFIMGMCLVTIGNTLIVQSGNIVTLFVIPTFHMFSRKRQLCWCTFTLTANTVLTALYVRYFLPVQDEFVTKARDLKHAIIASSTATCLSTIFAVYLGNLVANVYEEVQRTNEMIESNTREKEEFFATISHEIRNPLQSLQGSVELLTELNKANPAQLAQDLPPLLEICRGCCGIVINLVSNILDMSKIAADKMQLSPAPTDLREVINRVLRTSRGRAESKSVTLRLDCDPDFPPAIEVDPQRVEQVLVNLVANAIKFTPARGRIVVKASWLEESNLATALSRSNWKQTMELAEDSQRLAVAGQPFLIRRVNTSCFVSPSHHSKLLVRKDSLSGFGAVVASAGTERNSVTEPSNRRQQRRPRQGWAKIEVMDSGIGIAKDSAERLFKPYQQADSGISRYPVLPHSNSG